MNITVAHEQGQVPVTVFHISGSVDAASYQELEDRAQDAISSGTLFLLLDLSQVPYMSSAGLRAINYIHNLLDRSPENVLAIKQGLASGKTKSPHIKLLNPTPHVMQVLGMAGYDMFLEIHRDVNQALASF